MKNTNTKLTAAQKQNIQNLNDLIESLSEARIFAHRLAKEDIINDETDTLFSSEYMAEINTLNDIKEQYIESLDNPDEDLVMLNDLINSFKEAKFFAKNLVKKGIVHYGELEFDDTINELEGAKKKYLSNKSKLVTRSE